MWPWMNMNPHKNQIDVINGFDFIRKLEVSVLFEQVCSYMVYHCTHSSIPIKISSLSWAVGIYLITHLSLVP